MVYSLQKMCKRVNIVKKVANSVKSNDESEVMFSLL